MQVDQGHDGDWVQVNGLEAGALRGLRKLDSQIREKSMGLEGTQLCELRP